MEPSANELLTVIGIVLVAIIIVSALIALIVLLMTGRLSNLLASRQGPPLEHKHHNGEKQDHFSA